MQDKQDMQDVSVVTPNHSNMEHCIVQQWWKDHMKKRVSTCVFVCACDCLNLSYTRELQSLNFSEQYVSNPGKQLALHLEHTRIRGLI